MTNHSSDGASSSFNDAGEQQGPVSIYQIKNLEASRPKPEPSLEHTPEGDAWTELNEKQNQKRNQEMTKQTDIMRERLEVYRGRLKKGYDKARDRDSGRSR